MGSTEIKDGQRISLTRRAADGFPRGERQRCSRARQVSANMVPAGYMYKTLAARPDLMAAKQVRDICAVSSCLSADFCDFIHYWRHNGYWFFDTPTIMESIARENDISLKGMRLFFYYVYPYQWDAKTSEWLAFSPAPSFETEVVVPPHSALIGFDVVTVCAQTGPACSPLSCNGLAATLPVNEHCLFDSFEAAKIAIESHRFEKAEPGPYRIFEVRGVTPALTVGPEA